MQATRHRTPSTVGVTTHSRATQQCRKITAVATDRPATPRPTPVVIRVSMVTHLPRTTLGMVTLPDTTHKHREASMMEEGMGNRPLVDMVSHYSII